MASTYLLNSILIPFLVFSMAAIGLNLLTGYCGQLSLGTGGFMACGAFFAYKLTTAFPELHIVLVFLLSGLGTAMVGILFGLPRCASRASTWRSRRWRRSSSWSGCSTSSIGGRTTAPPA